MVIDLNFLINMTFIMTAMFIGIMASNFPTISNCSITKLEQIKRCDAFLSEFHYKGDNLEDEIKNKDRSKDNRKKIKNILIEDIKQ